jgi:murein L,D-transpeptidase YafK
MPISSAVKTNLKRLPILLLPVAVTAAIFFSGPSVKSAEEPSGQGEVVIIVDKKLNQLHVARNHDGVTKPFKTYSATLGQKLGDKMVEGDLKTPEGIYDFLFRSLPSTGLKPEFGVMAIYVSYPNILDKRGNKTGFDILIHGTDKPERLQLKYDSKGCVVLANEQVEEIWPHIKLKSTRVVITQDFTQIANPDRREKLKKFFDEWLKAWNEKNIDAYTEAYADEFTNDKMNRIEYSKYKDSLNKAYETIKVTADNRQFFFHEKYDLITFDQTYESTLPGGKPGFKLQGKKNLYVQMRNGHYRILAEELVK